MSENKTQKNTPVPSQNPKQPQQPQIPHKKIIDERGSTIPEFKTPIRPPKK